MTWLIGTAGVAATVLFVTFCIQAHQTKIEGFAEAIRIHIKAEGGQNITVKRLSAPHLTGALLFSVTYTDVNSREIINQVTVHTAGQFENKQFWGEPVTPAFN